ncbi:metallophosphoesterase [Pseudomaricurvus sp. HS19]|uniref:metallophosphoesterase family protein n=1 Tax=Pseudomaricurvus sp. HS19 TaxID=2692626 RepID=UPI00136D2F84|nr:metallophosphoesterase [Pseudomaricurvus sp. HS19]MYM64180.1 metallophosphoesterase [Pseudomaricurvus sp. HS19]
MFRAQLNFVVVMLAVVWLVGCATTNSEPVESDTFVVIGDRTGGERPGVYAEMMQYAATIPAKAWLSVGDLIEGYSEDPAVIAAEWAEFDKVMSAYEVDFEPVPGNHDISNTLQKQMWVERYGRTYTSVRYGDVLWLLLDTEDPPVALSPEMIAGQARLMAAMKANPEATQAALLKSRKNTSEPVKLPGSVAISAEQLAWAQQVLEENADARWTFVIMHKPAWQYEHPRFLELETSLQQRNYTVIAGHEHYFQQEQRFGRDYITMATCGGIWLQEGAGKIDHLLEIRWQGDKPELLNHIREGDNFRVVPLADK